jgi:hypothetical protein
MHDIRVAWLDARRRPGILVVGAIVCLWPLSGFSWLPLAIAVGAALLVVLGTRRMYWRSRWYIRRRSLPFIGAATMVALAMAAGPLAWGITIGVGLVVAGATDRWRTRRRLRAWVLTAIARSLRADPAALRFLDAEWNNTQYARLKWAEIDHRGTLRVEDPNVRKRVAEAIGWALRHAGRYTVTWPPGRTTCELRADPPLPTLVLEPPWGAGLPGIPIGVTDADTADGHIDIVDARTGEGLDTHPVAIINPHDSEHHYLVVGGTGSGKSVWTRGFVARGMVLGWWPGGVWLFDGKGGSDFLVFENRQGVHCVAREPDEWAEAMPAVSQMMRDRYQADAAYHRGETGKPSRPRYLVVLDEVQQIRATLGKDIVDPFLQQMSRQMRASNGRLLVATQRPDSDDAIPGAVRDMLEERIILGYVSGTGARMVLENDWEAATDEYGAESVPGRGIARIGGRLLRIQSFKIGLPREDPAWQHCYPPTIGQQPPTAPVTARTTRWAHTTPSGKETPPTDPTSAPTGAPTRPADPTEANTTHAAATTAHDNPTPDNPGHQPPGHANANAANDPPSRPGRFPTF